MKAVTPAQKKQEHTFEKAKLPSHYLGRRPDYNDIIIIKFFYSVNPQMINKKGCILLEEGRDHDQYI